MKYILFNIIYNNFRQYLKTKPKETYELSNIHDKKKYKESKIVKKWLGWINLLVVSRGKCNNGIKRENSTESLSIGPKREGMPFSGMIRLKLKFFKSM